MTTLEKETLDPAIDALCAAAGTRQEDVISLSLVFTGGGTRLTVLAVDRDDQGNAHPDPDNPTGVASTLIRRNLAPKETENA